MIRQQFALFSYMLQTSTHINELRLKGKAKKSWKSLKFLFIYFLVIVFNCFSVFSMFFYCLFFPQGKGRGVWKDIGLGWVKVQSSGEGQGGSAKKQTKKKDFFFSFFFLNMENVLPSSPNCFRFFLSPSFPLFLLSAWVACSPLF